MADDREPVHDEDPREKTTSDQNTEESHPGTTSGQHEADDEREDEVEPADGATSG
jgi:hypothetical protein